MRSRARHRRLLLAAAFAAIWTLLSLSPGASLALTNINNTPFPSSQVITGARWTSVRRDPPQNQYGDILPNSWADNGDMYVLMDDGGTDTPPRALWRNSFAKITGSPLHHLRFHRIGAPPAPATWSQIRKDPTLWSGPLGSHYASGFIAVNHVFYATQVADWSWSSNGPFTGLTGIAYSLDQGRTWQFPARPFLGPTGNLNWVQRGRDAPAPDGYVYAIATEREFNANSLILGRSRADVADITDPSRWQWASGWVPFTPDRMPVWSNSISNAQPILSWPGHITYPRMSYDAGLNRYLLTYTYSYFADPPGVWQNGSELVIMEGPHPWGPFSFVARGVYFGPSNGYDPTIPLKWISNHGQDIWLAWAANFDGCAAGLLCTALYGFNYQRLHLVTPGHPARDTGSRKAVRRRARAQLAQVTKIPRPPARWRNLPATPPPFALPRLGLGPP